MKVSGICEFARSERDSEPVAEPGVAESIVGLSMQRHRFSRALVDTAEPTSIDHLAAGGR